MATLRIMCVYLPDWPIQRRWREEPALREKPVALSDPRAPRGPQVVSCCPRARRGGVQPGMPVAEALAVRPSLVVRNQDPEGDTRALGRLARWLERYSPIVGLEEGPAPQSILLDITGCAECFQGEDRLLARAFEELRAEKWLAGVAVADSVGAAWGLAHYGRAEKKGTGPLNARGPVPFFSAPPGETERVLRDLPVAALRLPAETLASLARLGIDRVGALLDLPRDVLPARFGARVLERLDQALGRLPEVIAPYRPAPEVEAFYHFEFPTDRRDVLEHALDQMVRQVETVLRQRSWGARRVECTLFHGAVRGSPDPAPQPSRIDLGLHQASDSADHIRTLLGTQLDQLRLTEPVRTVRLRVPVAEPITGRQDEFFESGATDGQELSILIDRLSVRVGREAVTRVALVPDAQPEYACRLEPLVGPACRAGPGGEGPARQAGPTVSGELRVFVHRPLRLLPEPAAIEVVSLVPDGPPIRFWWAGADHQVTRSWGPERIETGWWRGRDARRDYYAVTTQLGTRFWIFRRRDDGRWFLHGCFD